MSEVPGDPFTAFSFRIELWLPGAAAPLCDAAFAECEGLELRFDVAGMREGGQPGRHQLLSSPAPPGRVTLRRGMTASMDLWRWCSDVARDGGPRARCDVVVLSPDGTEELVRFVLRGALPLRLRGPHLNAAAGGVAIEELELVGESLSVSSPDSGDVEHEAPVALAELRELDPLFEREINQKRWVRAHINPDSLEVSYRSADAISGGVGTAALTVELWVDATAATRPRRSSDIHELVAAFAYFVTPRAARGSREPAAPAVRFTWGALTFDGYVETLRHSFGHYSADGRPQLARLSVGMSRPWIDSPPG
ncbi:MAG: phage tail protein [Mycobacteriales bacterium]